MGKVSLTKYLTSGDEEYFGGSGNDVIYGMAGKDIIWGEDGDDRIYGGTENDQLFGGNGNDYLSGGNDDDLLWGGNGNNTLIGGYGADTFALTYSEEWFPTATNTISDFVSSVDKIIVPRNEAINQIGSGNFVAGINAVDSNDYYMYNRATGQLFYDADANGNGSKVLLATLLGSPDLKFSDLEFEKKKLLIDFEDLSSDQEIINYLGLSWSNFYSTLNTGYGNNSGYTKVLNSGNNVGYNAFGDLSFFSNTNKDFDFASGYFAAAWNNNLVVTIEAWDDNVKVGTATIQLDPNKVWVDFAHQTAQGADSAVFTGRFTSIDKVTIVGVGGVDAGLGGGGTHVAMDDLLLYVG